MTWEQVKAIILSIFIILIIWALYAFSKVMETATNVNVFK